MGYLPLMVPFGLIPAFIAKAKGRDFGKWWIYGAAFFPVALIHALMLESSKPLSES